jgi:hypothetical protein
MVVALPVSRRWTVRVTAVLKVTPLWTASVAQLVSLQSIALRSVVNLARLLLQVHFQTNTAALQTPR